MFLQVLLALLLELSVTRVESNECGGKHGVYQCHPNNPTQFDICIGDRKYTMDCPSGLHFDSRTQICDWPPNADCGNPDFLSQSSLHMPQHQQLNTNPSNSPIVPSTVDANFDSENTTVLSVRESSPERLYQRQRYDKNYNPTVSHSSNHISRSDLSDDGDDDEDYGNNVRDSLTKKYNTINKIRNGYGRDRNHFDERRTGWTGNRNSLSTQRKKQGYREQQQRNVRRQNLARRNLFQYGSARNHRQRLNTLNHKQQTPARQHRKAQDGYNRYENNAARKRKLQNSRHQRRHKSENHILEVTKNDMTWKTVDNSNSRSENNPVFNNRYDNHYERAENRNSLKKNPNKNFLMDVERSNNHNMDVGSTQKLGINNVAGNNYDTNNKDLYETANRRGNIEDHPATNTKPEMHVSFNQGHFPWWAARSATPKILRRRFPLPTPKITHVASRVDPAQRLLVSSASRHQVHNDLGRAHGDRGRSRRPGFLLQHGQAQRGSRYVEVQKLKTASAARDPAQGQQHVSSITAAAAAAPKRTKKPRKTGKCSPETCQLPECRCVGTDIPRGLPVEETPQIIMLTFDDSVNVANFDYYNQLLDGRFRNPNGCPIKSTFFVSGDATQYHFVDKLHKRGQEIASHSLSHRSPTTYWASAGYDGYVSEIEGMRKKLSSQSHIPRQDIRGMRVPFLQLGGDDQFQMLEDFGYTYDTSMVTGHLYRNNNPPIWPFTLDYPPDSKTCSLTPCPSKSYPGLWEVPLVRWYGSNRLACAMPDGCTIEPGQQGTQKYLEENFLRHYQTNRAPLGIFLHASWFRRKEGNLEALMDFLKAMSEKKDVWVVSVSQMLDWMQNPVPNSQADLISSWSCD